MYKKFYTMLLCIICVIALCSCGGVFAPSATPVPRLSPSDIMSVDEAAEFTGYAMLQDGDITERDGKKTVVYVSNPKGESDSVTVKITQCGDNLSIDEVWNRYDSARLKRPSAKTAEGIGSDAYVAFPYIHIYDRGCEITIAAGSGSDDGQEALLKRMGERAVNNLRKYISE